MHRRTNRVWNYLLRLGGRKVGAFRHTCHSQQGCRKSFPEAHTVTVAAAKISLSLQYNTVNPYSRAAEGLVKAAARCSGSKLEGIDREMSRKGCCHKGLNDTSSLTTTSSSSTLRREHDFALRQDVDANAWAEGQAAKTVRVRGFSNRTKPRKIRSVSYLDPRETNIGFRRSTSARCEKPLSYLLNNWTTRRLWSFNCHENHGRLYASMWCSR